MRHCPVSSLKVIHKYSFTFLQESTESVNTTIEDEDLKGKAWRFSGRVSAHRRPICCCFPSSICLPSVLLLNHIYILSCLFSPPNLYCLLQPFSPPLHPSFVSPLKGVCFSISCRVFYLKCLLFRLSCSCVSSSYWFNVQPDALEASALIQSGNPRAARKTPSPSRRPTPRCRVSPLWAGGKITPSSPNVVQMLRTPLV